MMKAQTITIFALLGIIAVAAVSGCGKTKTDATETLTPDDKAVSQMEMLRHIEFKNPVFREAYDGGYLPGYWKSVPPTFGVQITGVKLVPNCSIRITLGFESGEVNNSYPLSDTDCYLHLDPIPSPPSKITATVFFKDQPDVYYRETWEVEKSGSKKISLTSVGIEKKVPDSKPVPNVSAPAKDSKHMTLQEENKALKSQMSQLHDENAALKNKSDQWQEKNKTLETELQGANAKIADLETQVGKHSPFLYGGITGACLVSGFIGLVIGIIVMQKIQQKSISEPEQTDKPEDTENPSAADHHSPSNRKSPRKT